MHPTTERNLVRALEREAVAAARLTAYAKQAEQEGDPNAARTLRAIAQLDLEHAADMAELLGWVGSLHENVLASVVGDATTHGLEYATLAGEARTVGDTQAAELFRRLAADETEAAIGLLALASSRSAGMTSRSLDQRQRRPAPSPIHTSTVRSTTVHADAA